MRRILLVDDNSNLLDSLKRHFRPFSGNWDIRTAGNGEQALNLAREHSFDLAIVDLLMPLKGGLETIAEMRRDFPSVKIIAISGGGRTGPHDVLEKARQAGAHRTLEKPFTPKSLHDAMQALLTSATPEARPPVKEPSQ